MRRRTLLGTVAGLLAIPHVSHAQATTTLKFIPVSDLVILDPVWTGARVTRNHGYLVFDTLYGVDEAARSRRQALRLRAPLCGFGA